MSLSKPYYRITRPGAYIPDYVTDLRYAADRIQLSRAYLSIEGELRKIFNYIEPDESNRLTFSFALYSLLLRACTEVEVNCKEIMEANGYSKRNMGMRDYTKLEKSSKLSCYQAVYRNWRQDGNGSVTYKPKILTPFQSFASGTSPAWYQAYNKVKHNREDNLELANLENCMNAVAAILILLYSQFGSCCIESYASGQHLHWHEMGSYDNAFDADVMFDIKPLPKGTWAKEECYDFDWNALQGQAEPFDRFGFSV